MARRRLLRTRTVSYREEGWRHECEYCKGDGQRHANWLRYTPLEGSALRKCTLVVGRKLKGKCESCRGKGYTIVWTEIDDDG